MTSYSRSEELAKLLLPVLFITGCSASGEIQTPQDTLRLYVLSLSEGNLDVATALKYTPLLEWSGAKEVIGAALIVGLMSLIIRLTGLNPFTTLLSCYIVERYVSPENRKFIYIAVALLGFVSVIYAYTAISSILTRTVVEIDRVVVKDARELKILGTDFQDSRAYVDYLIEYADGKERKGRALLLWRKGRWYVKEL